MRKTGAVAGLLLLALILACGKKQADQGPAPEPTPLFKPSMSYWNLAQAKQALRFNAFETIEDREPLVSDKRPVFRLLVIKLPNYPDHGFSGDLVLSFYNDRLMKTQYYVKDMQKYLNAAAAAQQAFLSNDKSGSIAPHTKVWLGKEQDGREYLGMEDEILKQQMNDWINRYSAG